MLKVNLFLYLFFFALINITSSNAKIVFFDMDKVMSTSKPGSSLIKQLNELNSKNLKIFQDKKKNLEKKEAKIISQKNIISKEEFKLSINKLKVEINNFNQDREMTFSNFNKLRIENSNKLITLINPLLKKYSDEQSIDIILRKKNLIIGKSELDITDEIIIIINNNIKEFTIN